MGIVLNTELFLLQAHLFQYSLESYFFSNFQLLFKLRLIGLSKFVSLFDMELQYTKVQTLQPVLATQINELKKALSLYHQEGFLGAILFGSCALGNATYRSDIDIFLIFAIEKLDFSFVSSIRENVESFFEKINKREILENPLPVEFQVVRESVFLTSETEMKKNLKSGIILVDNSGRLGRKIREINE